MEVNDPEDIVQMKTNESYVIVEVSAYSQGEQDGLRKETEEVTIQNADAAPEVKKRGRKRKELPAPAVVEQVQPAVEQDWV
jgi:hypothetical protein